MLKTSRPMPLTDEQRNEILDLLRTNRKIEAIKTYRRFTSVHLSEALDAINRDFEPVVAKEFQLTEEQIKSLAQQLLDKGLVKKYKKRIPDRQVIVVREPDFRETITINYRNLIVCHHSLGCLIDEGPRGASFRRVYSNVGKVIFTGQFEDGKEIVKVTHAQG